MKQPPEQKPPRPLSGLKVIDMSTVLMGPLATQVLADYGADMIKIEPPEGDVMRHAGPSRTERMGPMYLGAGRNKRSVVIDIKRPGGREALLRLCESAAMFIHNIRQPAMAHAGLAYEDLRKVSPSIVYLSLVGYGANIQLIDKTTELAPGVHVISLVSDKPGTLELRELSLALSTLQGLVLVVGCSHPGIDRILEAAAKIDPRIHLISGGMHMVVSKDDEIAKTINVIQNTYKVAYVAPGHCTGEPAFDALSKAFGDRYLYAGVGARLMLGAKPQTLISDGTTRPVQPIRLSKDDRQGYRELAKANDQKRRGLFANLKYAELPNGAYLGQLQRSLMACC